MAVIESKLLRVKEVAERLSVHPETVYRLVCNSELASVRVGRAVRISEAALEQFKASQTQVAKPPLRLRF